MPTKPNNISLPNCLLCVLSCDVLWLIVRTAPYPHPHADQLLLLPSPLIAVTPPPQKKDQTMKNFCNYDVAQRAKHPFVSSLE